MSTHALTLPGTTFSAVTHGGRVIPLAKVGIRRAMLDEDQVQCTWFDENGKHAEFFNMRDTSKEFREIRVIKEGQWPRPYTPGTAQTQADCNATV